MINITCIDPQPEENLSRAVTLSNEEWCIIAQCVEEFSSSYRAKHSQTVCLWVTRNQLSEAVEEASRMNSLLQKLDKLQAKLM
jgi:hypothetical protein